MASLGDGIPAFQYAVVFPATCPRARRVSEGWTLNGDRCDVTKAFPPWLLERQASTTVNSALSSLSLRLLHM